MGMAHIKKRQCLHCQLDFIPDHRNIKKQKFCNRTPECKKASKAASQGRWRAKNPDYFTGSANVQRVQEWRQANPDRSSRRAKPTRLQDDCPPKTTDIQDVTPQNTTPEISSTPALQDLSILKNPVFIGLIAHLTGLVLQDDIDAVASRLEQLGLDVLNRSTLTNGGNCYDPKVPHLSRPHQNHPKTVQLGGPPADPRSPSERPDP
jgi:hypothetical protein